jgi:Undecaprenyl-phosphate galactose phosphotransferase WbaP
MSTDTAMNGPGSAIASSRRTALTQAPATERVPAPHIETKPSLEGLAEHARRFGTRSGLPTVLCYCLSDALSIVIALSIVRVALSLAGLAPRLGHPDPRLAAGFLAAAFILNWYQGLYSTVVLKPAAELRQIWFNALGLTAFFVAVQWVMMDMPTAHSSRLLWLALSSIAMALLLPLLRAACRLLYGRRRWWGRRVILVGCGERSAALYRLLRGSPLYGLRPVGFVENFDQMGDVDSEGYLGPIAELPERVAENDVNLALIVSSSVVPRTEFSQLVCQPGTGVRDWLIIPDGAGLPSLWTVPREVAGMPAIGVVNRLQCGWQVIGKRLIDLAIVVLLAPLWVPLVYGLALVVRLGSKGKAFYSQQRLGLDGETFHCWKLRSMVANADEVLQKYLAENPELQAEWDRDHKLKNDPRITWIGRILRKTSLDELPQLFNVLYGEMSIVGPRPIVSAEIEKYGEVWKLYKMVTPGITGLWQVNGRNNTTYQERLDFDEYYVRNWSVWFDLYIMMCTVKVVCLREGAY